ncbi:hypothetical protein KSP39_PZI016268 [Platanthera zijinensis]|uniref:Uncharacterized protein n=1 Tax=Platanthera zijinensis TaxID=2320716 RepID=A0AAP0B6Z4_9ASPA
MAKETTSSSSTESAENNDEHDQIFSYPRKVSSLKNNPHSTLFPQNFLKLSEKRQFLLQQVPPIGSKILPLLQPKSFLQTDAIPFSLPTNIPSENRCWPLMFLTAGALRYFPVCHNEVPFHVVAFFGNVNEPPPPPPHTTQLSTTKYNRRDRLPARLTTRRDTSQAGETEYTRREHHRRDCSSLAARPPPASTQPERQLHLPRAINTPRPTHHLRDHHANRAPSHAARTTYSLGEFSSGQHNTKRSSAAALLSQNEKWKWVREFHYLIKLQMNYNMSIYRLTQQMKN